MIISYNWECGKNKNLDLSPKKVYYNWFKISTENDLMIINADFNLTNNIYANRKIYNYIKNTIDNFVINTNNNLNHNNWKYELSIKWEYKKVGSLITYKITIYKYSIWVLENMDFKTFNFMTNWTEIIIKNPVLLKKISDYSINYFKNININPDKIWLEDGLSNNFQNYSKWLITWYSSNNLKLNFIFPPYQIAPATKWTQTIEINTKDLK
jgi:hypothetical protein